MGKQLLLYIENPFLVKNVTKCSTEAQRIGHRVNALSLQTELMELHENPSLQDAHCDPVTFWTKKVSAEDARCLQKTKPPHPHHVLLQLTAVSQRFFDNEYSEELTLQQAH